MAAFDGVVPGGLPVCPAFAERLGKALTFGEHYGGWCRALSRASRQCSTRRWPDDRWPRGHQETWPARNPELAQAAKGIAMETGLEHRLLADGYRVAGIYRRSAMLDSGRYAMLDDDMGLRPMPWEPMIEQRLGR